VEILRDKIILVVAADAGSRDAVSEEFRRHGCHVLPVTGGFEAYELARERHVDAVAAAGRLSSGAPTLLLSDVRRLDHDVPVLLFGGAGEELSQTEALHRGFAAYFLHAFPTAPIAEAAARSLEFVAERKKKKVERVAVAATAEIRFGEPPVEHVAPVLNLSRGGMFLSLERGLPALQSTIDFRLTIAKADGQPPIEGKALVRWVRDRAGSGHLPGIGVEFTALSPEAQEFLDAYVGRASARR
jgi:CheY-like chemotaxis protein